MADILAAQAPQKNKETVQVGCTTCEVEFSDLETHKAHYRSDFHAYNLRRRVLSLPPIAEPVYEENKRKVVGLGLAPPKSDRLFCQTCGKSFHSEQTLTQHFESRRHREGLKQPHVPSARQVGTSLSGDPRVCLFCLAGSNSLEENFAHMEMEHGFVLPRAKRCLSLQAVYCRLSAAIEEQKVCIFCDFGRHHRFHHASDVRQHMRDRGHLQLSRESLEEVAEFYIQEDQRDLLGRESEDDWVDADDEEGNQVLPSGELQLADGRIVGHRQYRTYYMQRLATSTQSTERLRQKLLRQVPLEAAKVQKMGLVQLQQLSLRLATEQRQCIAFRRREARLQGFSSRAHTRHRTKNHAVRTKRHNRVLSKHFRVQFRQ